MRGMQRADRKLSQEQAIEILKKGTWGVLSSVCDDGLPYGVPISYVTDGGYTVYFHGAKAGQKLDNLAHNNRVCLTVVPTAEINPQKLTMRYESAMAFGTAQVVIDEREREKAFELLIEQLAPTFAEDNRAKYIARFADEAVIIRMDVEYISGKANPS